MPRGLPDYYNASQVIAQRMVDLSSLGALVIGASTLDGRGRLYFFDTFREGLTGWVLSAGGNGTAPYLTTLAADYPPACTEFLTGTLAGSGFSQMVRTAFVGPRGLFGVEISSASLSSDYVLRVLLEYYGDGTIDRGEFKYKPANDMVYIVDPTGEIPIMGAEMIANANTFRPIKLVIDTLTSKYARIMVGQEQVDLTQALVPFVTVDNLRVLKCTIRLEPTGASSATVHVGHVAITLDEP